MQVRRQSVYIFDTSVVTMLEDIVAPPHRHGMYQLMLSLDGAPVSVGPDLESVRPGLIHLIGSNEAHAVQGHGGFQAVMQIAQDATVSRRLAAKYLTDTGIARLPDAIYHALDLSAFVTAYEEDWQAPRFRPVVEAFLAQLADVVPRAPTAMHPGVRKALRIIRGLESKKISATELSVRVGLSRSHFLRTFKKDMGIPLRPFLQWLRFVDAFRLLVGGASVTEAAAAAGFTDSSHLNRVMWRAFAMRPTDVVRMMNVTVRVSTEALEI